MIYIKIKYSIGGGKTTLLNFLSNRMMSSNLGYSGNIMINGQIVSNVNEIGNQVAYVMQDDILLATMTPKGKNFTN